jgi:hypothetical protein
MLTCPNPSCRKRLPALTRVCSYCQADLSLLVDYVDNLQGAVGRAEELTREGKLAEAVWAYLEVLEVDPANAPARKQVSQVAAAVRNFDRAAASRRLIDPSRDSGPPGLLTAWLPLLGVLLVAALAFWAGYQWGCSSN